ncbi:MAG: phosphoribosylformylglycinamidine synthase [Bacteroidales bacterium]|nr:phosphoribosylformylglycinamidine synthase [Bacteroidales bacterium]
MVIFFLQAESGRIYGVEVETLPDAAGMERLKWLFGAAEYLGEKGPQGVFIGPRREMVTPWSTNAVEITQIMGIKGIRRIEEFIPAGQKKHDPMLQALFYQLDQEVFKVDIQPEPIKYISDLQKYNEAEGLALSDEEIAYLSDVSREIGRPLTDSEVFGFSQVNSEHCRHKIFNGRFIIDGNEKGKSLFALIKDTTKANPGRVVSAYRDNVAFLAGPQMWQFAPKSGHKPDFFHLKPISSVISLKAETHNFPTTVEPFNGAATGSGGEIRDRMAGGKGSLPLAGTAVYMTSYPRTLTERVWETFYKERPWLYHSPAEILIKASNGASDFGNKFGQPLICGSVLTFEHEIGRTKYGYDKVIMLAGGIGYAHAGHATKGHPQPGQKIVVMGGDNYRIGMGGGAVSSVETGKYANAIELNAVQRSNPEMQKRVANALRSLCESDQNPVVSIHDHGAGGHLNSLSELVDDQGGVIHLEKLPLGDPTLSAREIIGNESQERMGLVIDDENIDLLKQIAERERAPMYEVGQITGDGRFVFENGKTGERPLDLKLEHLFGNPPRLVITDQSQTGHQEKLNYNPARWEDYLLRVLQCEAVACKDWLTNKVDRSVTGRIACQQTAGPLQLPLNNVGVVVLDYTGTTGIATSLGHAPVAGIIDPEAASRLSVAEALTNLVWASLAHGLSGVSLSANWMWPCNNPGENARLYKAVEAVSDFAIRLGINIPTGKDSLSMTQKYPDGTRVMAPGTVIISAAAEVDDVRKTVNPVLKPVIDSEIIYIDFSGSPFHLGGSTFSQVVNALGTETPDVPDTDYFARAFAAVQELVTRELLLAGHDVSSGGLITTLLEMCFSQPDAGMSLDFSVFGLEDPVRLLFSEKPSVIIQTSQASEVIQVLEKHRVKGFRLGIYQSGGKIELTLQGQRHILNVERLREVWYRSSYLLDRMQSGENLALERFRNHARMVRNFTFPQDFTGRLESLGISHFRPAASGIKAAIIREKGSNGDREMAYSLWLAGFDVKDVHMTDLVSGRETLEDVHMIAFVGGFSNSDVLGSAKGWAGAFLYNEKARIVLEKFYARNDTLSLGVCNGCQLMAELGLIYPEHGQHFKMHHNDSGKYESSFLTVKIPENNSVMLKSLAGCELGIWVAHGEGKFLFPYEESQYNIVAKYSYSFFPGNPNGSMYDTAAVASHDGRHLAIMPHLERAIFPWQWGYYPPERRKDNISPWILAFVHARKWVEQQLKTMSR